MKIIIATNNKGKVREAKQILEPLGYEIFSQSEAGFNLNPLENGKTFEENSYIKAKALYDESHCAVFADDSGLEVDALDKRPGVYSARYGGEEMSYQDKCKMLQNELGNAQNRTARFVCVITYIDENGNSTQFRGECEGEIGDEYRGNNGFGFDPIFYVGDKSFAEISSEEKNKISHRAKALEKLADFLKK